jgi:hypothetical protein
VAAVAAAGGLVSLFTRGADVNIPSGTQVEMYLQRPLVLEEAQPGGMSASVPQLVPAPDQPKPLPKPDRSKMVCPPGALGCQ